jgi:hypothetical protein
MPSVTTWDDLLRPGDAASFFDRVPLPEFDASSLSYSSSNAWWLAELSRIIYRHDVEEEPDPPKPRRSTFLARAGLHQLAFFESREAGTQAFLVESTGARRFAALVFRGTERDPRDVASDLETLSTRIAGTDVCIHEGFKEGLEAVWPTVARELERLACPVFYAGHSLGAALATLAASHRPPKAVYTFGSPRVGNEAFVATLRSVAVYRVVDGTDIVTTLPPEIAGFRHAGELHQLGTGSLARTRLDPWIRLRRLFGPPTPLADHAPINYVDRIR